MTSDTRVIDVRGVTRSEIDELRARYGWWPLAERPAETPESVDRVS